MDRTDLHPREALHAYLDGELSLEGSLEVEAHLETCVACRQELATYRALRGAFQGVRERSAAADADALFARMRTSLAEGDGATDVVETARPVRRAPRPRWHVARVTLAAASLGLAGLLGWWGAVRHGVTEFPDEVASMHARALSSGRSVELASADPVALSAWLEPRVNYPVQAAAGREGFALRGARVEALNGAKVATLVYEVRGHPVDVLAWPSGDADAPPEPTRAGRWTVCRWAHRGTTYWMVSDAGTADLKALAAVLKESRT